MDNKHVNLKSKKLLENSYIVLSILLLNESTAHESILWAESLCLRHGYKLCFFPQYFLCLRGHVIPYRT